MTLANPPSDPTTGFGEHVGSAAVAVMAHPENAGFVGEQRRAHCWVTKVSGTTDIEGRYIRGQMGRGFAYQLGGWRKRARKFVVIFSGEGRVQLRAGRNPASRSATSAFPAGLRP